MAMEKDGWLDQALLAVLSVLTNHWLGILLALVAGTLIAYLGRIRPGNDWRFFLDDVREAILGGAFLLSAGLKSAPRLVLPKTHFVCDETTTPALDGLLELPVRTNCRWESSGQIHSVVDYGLGDAARDFFMSLLQEGTAFGVGLGIGRAVAMLALSKRT